MSVTATKLKNNLGKSVPGQGETTKALFGILTMDADEDEAKRGGEDMYFSMQDNILMAGHQNETIRIEAWGKNALRVRATQNAAFTGDNKALLPVETLAQTGEEEYGAS